MQNGIIITELVFKKKKEIDDLKRECRVLERNLGFPIMYLIDGSGISKEISDENFSKSIDKERFTELMEIYYDSGLDEIMMQEAENIVWKDRKEVHDANIKIKEDIISNKCNENEYCDECDGCDDGYFGYDIDYETGEYKDIEICIGSYSPSTKDLEINLGRDKAFGINLKDLIELTKDAMEISKMEKADV